MQLIKILFLFVIPTNLAYACLEVCENEEDFTKSDLIKVLEYDCDTKGECLIIVDFPKSVKGQEFSYAQLMHKEEKNLKFLVPLKVVEDGDRNKTSVFAQIGYLENFELFVAYTPKDGCAYNSLIELKHNKLKNEYASRAGTDAQKDARPF